MIVTVDGGTTYTFETAEYWAEEDGWLVIYGRHGGGDVRVLDRLDTWLSVAFVE